MGAALRELARREGAAPPSAGTLNPELLEAGASSRKWWAFEGFAHVDCCLETNAALFRTKTIHREACRSTIVSRLAAIGDARADRAHDECANASASITTTTLSR